MLSGRFRVLCLVLSLSVFAAVVAAEGEGDSARRDESLAAPANVAGVDKTDEDSAKQALERLLTAARANDAEAVLESLTEGAAKKVQRLVEAMQQNAVARQKLRETITRKFGPQTDLLKQLDDLGCECENCQISIPQLFAGAQLDELHCMGPRRVTFSLKAAEVRAVPESKPAATGELIWELLCAVRGRHGWKVCLHPDSIDLQLSTTVPWASELKKLESQIQSGDLETESEVRAAMAAVETKILSVPGLASEPGVLPGEMAVTTILRFGGLFDEDSWESVHLPEQQPAASAEAAFNQLVAAAAKEDEKALVALFTPKSARKVAAALRFNSGARRFSDAVARELKEPAGGDAGSIVFTVDQTMPGLLAELAALKFVSAEPLSDERVKLTVASSLKASDAKPAADGPLPGVAPWALFAVRSEAGWLLVPEFPDNSNSADWTLLGLDPAKYIDTLGTLLDELATDIEEGEVQSRAELAPRILTLTQVHVNARLLREPAILPFLRQAVPMGGADDQPAIDFDIPVGDKVTRRYKTDADGRVTMIESVTDSSPAESVPQGTVETVVAPPSIGGGRVTRIIESEPEDDLLGRVETAESVSNASSPESPQPSATEEYTPQAAFERLKKAATARDSEKLLATLTPKSAKLLGELLRSEMTLDDSAKELRDAIANEFGEAEDFLGIEVAVNALRELRLTVNSDDYAKLQLTEVRELTPKRVLLVLEPMDAAQEPEQSKPVHLNALKTPEGWKLVLDWSQETESQIPHFSKLLGTWAEVMRNLAGRVRNGEFERKSELTTAWSQDQARVMQQLYREMPSVPPQLLGAGSDGTKEPVLERARPTTPAELFVENPPRVIGSGYIAGKEIVLHERQESITDKPANVPPDTPQAAFERLQKGIEEGDIEQIIATLSPRSAEVVGNLLRNEQELKAAVTKFCAALDDEFGKADSEYRLDKLLLMTHGCLAEWETFQELQLAEVREVTPKRVHLILKLNDPLDPPTNSDSLKITALKTAEGWKLRPEWIEGPERKAAYLAKRWGLSSQSLKTLTAELRNGRFESLSDVDAAWLKLQGQIDKQLREEMPLVHKYLFSGRYDASGVEAADNPNAPRLMPAATPEAALAQLEASERAGDFEAVAGVYTAAYAEEQIAVSDPAENFLQAGRSVVDAMYLRYGPGDYHVKELVNAFNDSLSKDNLKKQLQATKPQTIEQQEAQADGTVLLTIRRTRVALPGTSLAKAHGEGKEVPVTRKFRAVREGEGWKLQPAEWTGPDGGRERRLEALDYGTARYTSLADKIATNQYPDSAAARKAYDEIRKDVQGMMNAARK